MTDSRNVERRVSLWMEEREAGTHFPDRMLSATFEQTRELRQARSIRWRTVPMLRSFTPLAAAGAAAAVTAIVGAFALNLTQDQRGLGAASPSPDPEPTSTATGDPVAAPYAFLDGEVIVSAPEPWRRSLTGSLTLGDTSEEYVEILPDPFPITSGCARGPTPSDAAALAQAIASDPDLHATTPVDVRVGGVPGLLIDISLAPNATICDGAGETVVLTYEGHCCWSWGNSPGLDRGDRMRLYLLDAPEGSSMRTLAIAIVTYEVNFERVVDRATPIVDSLQFDAR